MPRFAIARTAAVPLLLSLAVFAQDFRIETPAPRLFLQHRKLALLQKERDRQSIRWQQFESVLQRGAGLAEPGLAKALYSQVTGDPGPCVEAFRWALVHSSEYRQAALVFDWCRGRVPEAEVETLAGILDRYLQTEDAVVGLAAARDRLLAAIALADRQPQFAERHLRHVVTEWWEKTAIPGLKRSGRVPLPADLMALAEILHAVRDNVRLDLRQSAATLFQELPLALLLSAYPAPHAEGEQEYFLAAGMGGGAKRVEDAIEWRAAALSLVSYDASSEGSQFLQGFLMQDRFLMRDSRGSVYEFLWANPYQPGLSFHHAPLFFHSPRLGVLFLRSSWDEEATWLGYWNSQLQVFDPRGLSVVTGHSPSKPLRVGNAAIYVVAGELPGRIQPPDVQAVFFVGLRPGAAYSIEMEGVKRHRLAADSSGILAISMDGRPRAWLRARPE